MATKVFLALLASAVHAGPGPESRAPSEPERAAFFAYHQKQFPDDQANQPVFAVTRAPGESAWRIAASVDSPAQRGLKTLCRMRRSDFAFDAASRQWSAPRPARQLVWLAPGAQCRVPAQAAELLVRMPDSELVGLLTQQAALLQSARLLFAGNTACARQRAYQFSLASIDVGSVGASPEQMVGLAYRSDRDSGATVWVRRGPGGYDAWNVSCGP